MSGSSNFLVFDENALSMKSDADYSADGTRINGVSAGMASVELHNKLYRQVSVMVAALAQWMADQGQVVSDSDLAALTTVVANTIAKKSEFAAHLADGVKHLPAAGSNGQTVIRKDTGNIWGMIEDIVNSYVVGAGETISIGDLVAEINGNIKKVVVSSTPQDVTSASLAGISNLAYFVKACRLSDKTFVVAVMQSSQYVYSRVGRIVDGAISYSTTAVYAESIACVNSNNAFSVSRLSDTSYALSYVYDSNGYGYTRYCTVDDNLVITQYASTNFYAGSLNCVCHSPLSSNTYVIFYNVSSTTIKSKIATVNIGTGAVTVGAETTHTITGVIRDVVTLSANSVLLAYGTDCILISNLDTISTYGAAAQVNADVTQTYLTLVNQTTFLVFYITSANALYCKVGTINDTTITYGTASASVDSVSSASVTLVTSTLAVVMYTVSGTIYGNFRVITIDGNSVSISGNTLIESAPFQLATCTAVTAGNQVVFTYKINNDCYNWSIKFPTDYTGVIGLAKEAKNAGQDCAIVISGILRGLSGLTAGQYYYCSFDGKLTTNQDSGVLIGRALSTTDMLIIPVTGPQVDVASGTFSDTSTSIGAGATYTKTILLGINAVRGKIILRGYNATLGIIAKSIVFFTTNRNSTIGDFNKGVDGKVTDHIFCTDGSYILLQDAYINGSNLILIFANTSGITATLRVDAALWEVES